MQIAAACPNCYLKEHFDDFEADWVKELIVGEMKHEEGHLVIPDRPGLGVTLNHDIIKQHVSKENRYIALFKPGWETRNQYSD
jgi:L-alanine-DL-glutamate epimerase-like enolase superfamily enzyme